MGRECSPSQSFTVNKIITKEAQMRKRGCLYVEEATCNTWKQRRASVEEVIAQPLLVNHSKKIEETWILSNIFIDMHACSLPEWQCVFQESIPHQKHGAWATFLLICMFLANGCAFCKRTSHVKAKAAPRLTRNGRIQHRIGTLTFIFIIHWIVLPYSLVPS